MDLLLDMIEVVQDKYAVYTNSDTYYIKLDKVYYGEYSSIYYIDGTDYILGEVINGNSTYDVFSADRYIGTYNSLDTIKDDIIRYLGVVYKRWVVVQVSLGGILRKFSRLTVK